MAFVSETKGNGSDDERMSGAGDMARNGSA